MNKLSQLFRASVTIKFLTIGLLALVLLIPAQQIKSIIAERQSFQAAATEDISEKWGGEQTVHGPKLAIPFTKYKNGVSSNHTAHLLPEEVTINGDILPAIRKRGIFEVLVYRSDLHITGNFGTVEFNQWNADSLEVHWQDSSLSLGVSDLKGLKAPIKVKWNGTQVENMDRLGSTIQLEDERHLSPTSLPAKFSYELMVNGTEQLSFTPSGATTQVNLSSPWHSPSFTGDFLPYQQANSDEGFTAHWNVLEFNRNYPQQWMDNQYDVNSAAFGVKLIKPVNRYRQSMRSVKYAILFIALTFITFFFTELLSPGRMHPVQYTLVGMALLLFYTLLLALSELIPFNVAYLIASIANIGLITTFTAIVFRKRATTIATASLLLLLYAFLFSVLQLEQHALLIGSIGLFLIIALLMFLSARINWYKQTSEMHKNGA